MKAGWIKPWLLRMFMRSLGRRSSVRAGSGKVQRIALWQFGGVGDMLLATPVVRALQERYPDARIDLWCSDPDFAEPLRRFANVKAVHAFPVYDFDCRTLVRGRVRGELQRLLQAMAVQQPDLLISLHVPAMLDWWAVEWWLIHRLAPSHTLGIDPPFLSHASLFEHSLNASARDGIHYTLLYQRLMQQAGIACDSDSEFPLTDAEHNKAAALVDALAPEAERVVCMHVGARRLKLEGRMWPQERFVMLAEQLLGAGYTPLLIGVQDEREVTEAICKRVAGCGNLAGLTSLGETAALIALANGFIGHDSGPFHIAAAVHTPCVAICGRPDAEAEYLDYRRDDVVAMIADTPEEITADAVFSRAMELFTHG